MPRRNTTEENENNLTQADKDAAEKRREALESIPDPVYDGSIDFMTTYADLDLNVRDKEAYGFAANKDLYQSLKQNGLEKRGDTMIFSRQIDGRLKVLVGHLRHNLMTLIRKDDDEAATRDGRTIDDDKKAFARIFGLIYTGLTTAQEYVLLCDHSLRKGLTEFELAKSIGEFVESTKITDAKASIYFGLDKNKVRRLRMRYAMPTVFANYRLEKGKDKDVSYIKVGNEQLDALYSAYLSDRAMGCEHREEGLNFKRAWTIVVSNPDAFKRSSREEEKPASRERKTLIDQADSMGTNFGNTLEMTVIADVLKYAAGNEDVRLDKTALTLKEYVDTINREKETLATALMETSARVNELTDSLTELTNERNDLIVKLDELSDHATKLTIERDGWMKQVKDLTPIPVKVKSNGQRKTGK